MQSKVTVAVLGAGSFGSAIARVLAQAPATNKVNFWARRASVADEINTLRSNKQYIDADNVFPPKVTAFTSVGDAIRNASIIVIVVPSLYLQPLLNDIATNIDLLANDAVIVSLVKSLHYDGINLTTVCHEISEKLKLPTVALMGPNIFREMIRDEFAEATIGHLPADVEAAARVKEIFTTSTFRVSTCDDRVGVELCGGLKNVISLAAGFCEGLGQGANTKAAVIRLGLKEMSKFSTTYFGALGARAATFYEESCGVGDLLLTCTVGRGRQLAKSFVEAFESHGPCSTVEESHVRWEMLESETLNGMKLPDYSNAKAVFDYVSQKMVNGDPCKLSKFPLFSAIYQISYRGAPPSTILLALKTAVSSGKSSTNAVAPAKIPAEVSTTRNVNLRGRRCLITGAGQGIGRAIAQHVSNCGAHVVGMDKNKEALLDLQCSLPSCDILACNLLDVDDIRHKVEKYIEDNGPIDLLVNCAGVAKFQPFFETTTAAFDLQVGVNVRALFYLTQLVTKAMVDHKVKGGAVVHISSQSSTLPLAEHLVYSSSKATVDHMARIQAFELGQYGIRVNTIRPTVVLTALALEQWDADALEIMKQQIPLRRLATMEDVAMAVSWLLSDEASMITGSSLAVDGGRSMGGFGL